MRCIQSGARIRLTTAAGEITLRVAVSADVPMGVILAHKGRWSTNAVEGNINAINPGGKSDLAESCAVHSINVSVAAA
jgi:anaerobic selenocysteine-containing dehydrogenase